MWGCGVNSNTRREREGASAGPGRVEGGECENGQGTATPGSCSSMGRPGSHLKMGRAGYSICRQTGEDECWQARQEGPAPEAWIGGFFLVSSAASRPSQSDQRSHSPVSSGC